MTKAFRHTCMALACLALLTACGPRGKQFKIEGKFKDIQPGEVYIYNQADANACFDTLKVKDGTFVYSGEATEPTPYILVFQNALEHVIFVDAGKTLDYSVSASDMKNYVVNGSDENKLLNEFREETKKMTAVKTKAVARKFIENHPSSYVSLYMLDRYFVQDETISKDELAQLVKLLRKNFPNNIFLINLETNLKAFGRNEIGQTLPSLSMKTTRGNTFSTATLSKPFVLVGFWATWIDEQWDFLSAYRSFSKDYNSQLELVAVSLDNEMYRWEEAVRNDSLIIEHVCDGNAWNTDAVKKLGVSDLPFYVLADKKGKIVARGNTVDDMKKDVEANVKKNKKAEKDESDEDESEADEA